MSGKSIRKRRASRRYLDYESLDTAFDTTEESFDNVSNAKKSGKKRKILRAKSKSINRGEISAQQVEKTESRENSDRENEFTPRSKSKRKPLYSTDYINGLEGQEMKCSACEDFVTTSSQEAKEHLRSAHYYIARINSNVPLSMKEVRSALLLTSKDLNVIFQCKCGRTTRWPQTFGDHLLKCQQHGYNLLIEEENVVDAQPSLLNDAVIINGKPKRKSAIKAATTFGQVAEDLEESDLKPERSSENRSSRNRAVYDDDFRASGVETSEPDEEYNHDVDSEDYAPVGKTKPQTTQKALETLLREFQGKYRDPVPVPVPEEERNRWKSLLQKHGRIECSECGVSYTTSLGIEYHYQRCNKIDYGFKCLKCGLCFARNCHKLLISHLSSCYEMVTLRNIDTSGRRRSNVTKNHDLSVADFKEFTERHYVKKEQSGQVVHPTWRFQSGMWPTRKYDECERYFSPLKSSPILKTKGQDERVLQLFEVWHNPNSKHNTIYVGGAVWCVKWIPIFSEEQQQQQQYFITVSHSRGGEAQLMRQNSTSETLTQGCMTLWTCDRNGDEIERSYSICHDWGFVPCVEFCPSRNATKDRLCLLAVTSQAGFVRILALPKVTETNIAAFYLNPDPVAVLEAPDMSVGSCCLAWDPLRDHIDMLVGYANGSVDLFTLKQGTLLLTEDDAFEASKHVGNHGMAVTAVQWQMIEERRIVVSAALDPDVIIWDVDQGVALGKYRRSMSRDMKVLQFLPSVVVSFEESVSINPCVVVYESGAYKRGGPTVVLHTAATAYSLDVNHWRHMLATADSAGAVSLLWLTNSNKLNNFKNRNLQVTLYEVKQRFASDVDTLTEQVAHSVGTLEFKDHIPSWDKPVPNGPKLKSPSRLEYPLNAVLSVAFNPNWATDHLVASGLRCGIVRLSKITYRP